MVSIVGSWFIEHFFHFSFFGGQFIISCVVELLVFFQSILILLPVNILFLFYFLFLICLHLPLVLKICICSCNTAFLDFQKPIQFIFFFVHFSHYILIEIGERRWERIFMTGYGIRIRKYWNSVLCESTSVKACSSKISINIISFKNGSLLVEWRVIIHRGKSDSICILIEVPKTFEFTRTGQL